MDAAAAATVAVLVILAITTLALAIVHAVASRPPSVGAPGRKLPPYPPTPSRKDQSHV